MPVNALILSGARSGKDLTCELVHTQYYIMGLFPRMAKTLIVIVLLLKAFLFSPVYATTLSEYPLEPADTTSPRATLKTFIDNTNAAYHMYVEEGYSFENRVRLDAVTIRAMRCLDLSKLPPTRAFSRGREAAALIKEIMDRLTLPPYSSIPDFEEMKALEASGFPQRWRDQGVFPFPEVPDEHRMQVADTLDYPPMGSPDRSPHPQKAATEPELRKGSKYSK